MQLHEGISGYELGIDFYQAKIEANEKLLQKYPITSPNWLAAKENQETAELLLRQLLRKESFKRIYGSHFLGSP